MTKEELTSNMQILDLKIRQEEDPQRRAELAKQKQVLALKLEIETIRQRIQQMS